MIESNLINYKQVELIHEILQNNDVEDSLKKYKLSKAITKIQSLLDAQSKTVDIPETSSFDYKMFEFLIQSETQLGTVSEGFNQQVYTVDISQDVDYPIVKNVDTKHIKIGSKTYVDNLDAIIVYTSSLTLETFSYMSYNVSSTNLERMPNICFKDLTVTISSSIFSNEEAFDPADLYILSQGEVNISANSSKTEYLFNVVDPKNIKFVSMNNDKGYVITI